MENNIALDISRHFGLDEIIANILVSRGIDTLEKAEKFLYPKVDDLTPLDKYLNLKEITNRIETAIQNKESVVLYGDYDCDGICGVSILYLYLKSRGVNVQYFLPNRHIDGYGLSEGALEKIAESVYPDLIITVDCGITNWSEVQYAQEVLGIEVIVTDHHEPLETLPDCLIFNTKLCEEGGYRSLCGAGVALRLVESLAGLQESKKYYDIAALATVADIVPLTEDNRVIVYNGLKLINRGYRKGLRLLVDKCVKGTVKSSDIGFRLAPRINSVGRIDDANKVVQLFIDDDTFVLNNLINEIEVANDKRQSLTNDLVKDCMDKMIGYDFEHASVIVLYNKYWDDGVLGIASAKLVTEFNRPVILLTKSGDYYKGSGRSVEGINILDCVRSVEDLLYKYGGHAMACGLSLKEENIPDFITRINENCNKMFGENSFVKRDHSFCRLDSISMEFAKQLEYLQPYGEENREVEFYTELHKCNFNQLGTTDHVKYVRNGVDYIAYFALDKTDLLNSDTPKKINYNVSINTFRNTETPQVIIQEITADKIDGDINIQNYISQGAYPDKCLGTVNYVDQNQAENLIKNSKYGSVFICYDYDTYKNLNSSFLSQLVINNTFIDSLCPYNRIIFNPKNDVNLSYYENIVFLEKPLSKGFIDDLNINKDAKVYIVDNDSMIKKCAKSLLKYEELGKIFIAIRHALGNKVYTDIYTLYSSLEIANVDFNQFCVSIYIFINLGIVKINNNGIIIDGNVKTSLDTSELFLKLQEAYGK